VPNCERPAQRFREMTGQAMSSLFRAPGGKTSPALLGAARSCGWTHVGWAPAGFLGDELPSDRYPNASCWRVRLRDIRAGDVLRGPPGHLVAPGPWAPAVLEPLIEG
jgi:peptidoglycan-N-acetylmuramic acid deacetylase